VTNSGRPSFGRTGRGIYPARSHDQGSSWPAIYAKWRAGRRGRIDLGGPGRGCVVPGLDSPERGPGLAGA
jgi:hypothetical protein